MSDLISVRQVIEQHFALRLRLSSSPSPLGSMLTNAKLGLLDIRGENPTGELQSRFADLTLLVQDLTKEEYGALVLRFCGSDGHETYIRLVPTYELHPVPVSVGDTGGECKAITKSGSLCKLPRLTDTARCHLHQSTAATPAEHWTRGGEREVERVSEDRSLVEGTRARELTIDGMAGILRISKQKVRALFHSGCSKIHDRLSIHR